MNLQPLVTYLCRYPRTGPFIQDLNDVSSPRGLSDWFHHWSTCSNYFNELLDKTEVREITGIDF